MTDGLSDLLEIVNGKGRRVYVAEKPINLGDLAVPNNIYILQLPDGSTAAGGRGGGFGERRIVKVYHFECGGGSCRKVGEFEDDERLDSLDLPYHATAMPILDPQGAEKLVSGVVDGQFAESYRLALG
jgi:hypothetical protein